MLIVSCLEGTTPVADQCYEIINTPAMTRSAVETYCNQNGGQLASMTSDNSHTVISTKIQGLSIPIHR